MARLILLAACLAISLPVLTALQQPDPLRLDDDALSAVYRISRIGTPVFIY